MAGLRERKKRATRAAIHHAALQLFGEHGFAATTVDQIAEAADVSRATVFSYYATKEDIVFGDAPLAVEALAGVLRDRSAAQGVIASVRDWLGQLDGWFEPEMVLQLQLAREVPAIGARRAQFYREVEGVVASALAVELGPKRELPARLAAAALIGAVSVAEESAATRMEKSGRALSSKEITGLLDDAVAFAEAGMAALER